MKIRWLMQGRRGAARRGAGFSLFVLFGMSVIIGMLLQIMTPAAVFGESPKIPARQGLWRDSLTITVDKNTYVDGKLDSTDHTFTRVDDPDGCPDVVDDVIGYGDTTGKLQIKTKIKGAGCDDSLDKIDVKLKNANSVETSLTALKWSDRYKIVSVDGEKTFIYDKEDDLYYRDEDGNPCLDTIEIDSTKDKKSSGKLIIRKKKGNGFLNKSTELAKQYSGYPFSGVEYDKDEGVCWKSKPLTVKISHLDNYEIKDESATKPTDGNPGSSTTSGGGEPEDCQIQGSIGWILNPVCDIATGFTKELGDYIQTSLRVEPLSQGSDSGVYGAWKLFRDLANSFLVIIFLIAIFAQVLPFELDPYMVKKVLPKLIAAAIGIQFSFFICQIMVDISNVLGGGVESIFNTAISQLPDAAKSASASNLPSMMFASIIGVTIMVFFIGPVILLLLAGLLSIITMLITIQARQVILILLALASPLAILAWVLPNTEQYAQKWAKNYIKLLMMYPLIACILEGSRFAYGVLSAAATTSSTTSNASLLQQIMISFIPVIAFFMVPATFKASGAITGAIANAGLGRAKGMSGRASSGAKTQVKGLKDNFQRSMSIQANDKSKNAGLRFGARALSGAGLLGTLNAGKRARYQNAKRGEEGLNEEMKLITNQLTEEGLNGDNAGLKRWLEEKPRSKAEQIAAMQMLGDNGGIEELSAIYEKMEAENDGKPSAEWKDKNMRDIWQQGTTNSRQALAKALPHSVRPDHDRSFGKLDAEGFASVKGAAGKLRKNKKGQVIASHIETGLAGIQSDLRKAEKNLAKATAAGNAEDMEKWQETINNKKGQLQKSLTSMVSVGQSTDRRGRIDADNVKAFARAVEAGYLDDTATVKIGSDNVSARDFVDRYIDKATGQLKAVSEKPA